MRCTACDGVWHESTGQCLSDRTRLCGPCVRDFVRWLKGHTQRPWRGFKFYEFTETSRNKLRERGEADAATDLFEDAERASDPVYLDGLDELKFTDADLANSTRK